MAKSQQRHFEFNLLPPKSAEELALEAERDDSLLYAVILVVFSLVIYGVLVLVQLFVIDTRTQELNNLIASEEAQIANFQSIRTSNGELYIKGLILEPLLERDLQPDQIFQVADAIESYANQVGVVSYARETSGVFVYDVLAVDPRVSSTLIAELVTRDDVAAASVRSIQDSGSEGLSIISIEVSIIANG